MKYLALSALVITLSLFSCKSDKKDTKGFEVSGTITNNPGKIVYLEELPMATMQAVVVDSAEIGKDGTYELEAGEKESSVFNLRLDQNPRPFAAIINDAKKIRVDVTFNKENKEFAEKYEVSGSPASEQMKEFMFGFNGLSMQIFMNDQLRDSLSRKGSPDSVILDLQHKRMFLADSTRNLTESFIRRSTNPALTMFELGAYQTSANNPYYQLNPFSDDEVNEIVNQLAAKYPDHKAIAAIKKTLGGNTGMPAPEFQLPDPNGKPVRLSSFRGKYVLVDFWASWCRPCRDENPNVVKAYNRFKNKNFTILGVSLDKPGEKEKWMNAVAKDKLSWNHVSDLMEWNSPVVAQYKIDGIPYNVLVDPSGNIIGEKLFGEKLEKKLEEVLK